jgi:hypothetical protein
MTFRRFLESVPPSATQVISDLRAEAQTSAGVVWWRTTYPDIQLHCDSESCGGIRTFACTTEGRHFGTREESVFIVYFCRNCRRSYKEFALMLKAHADEGATGTGRKFGEHPQFGPRVAGRVLSLMGTDQELFSKGRQAENNGFGLGAFAYYRRVVENQKGRIIRELAKAARRLEAPADVVESLEAAANETRFKDAIEQVKAGLPASLQIGGQNPLTLLHSALSEWMHQHTDEECLQIAADIRVILSELAERISTALKEQAEISSAVSRLLEAKSKSANRATAAGEREET